MGFNQRNNQTKEELKPLFTWDLDINMTKIKEF